MCLGGHLVRFSLRITELPVDTIDRRFAFVVFDSASGRNWLISRQAAFDPRILASVCFFATDVHCATLGKGKNDDSLARVRRGDLTGKGELVVCASCHA